MNEQSDRPVMLSDLVSLKTDLKSEIGAELISFKTDLKSEISAELTSFKTDLKSEISAELTSFKTDLKSEISAELTSFKTDLKSEIAADMTSLKTELKSEIVAEGEKSRRRMDVVAEDLRGQFKVVIEKTEATAKKVDRLIASNAVEHAAFVEAISDHEVRLRVLEKAQNPAEPTVF